MAIWTGITIVIGTVIVAVKNPPTWLAAHDEEEQTAEPEAAAPKHEPLPKDKVGQLDVHGVKKAHDVPKGSDLYWDPETEEVYAQPKGVRGEATGEGENLGTWEDLVNAYPKLRGGAQE